MSMFRCPPLPVDGMRQLWRTDTLTNEKPLTRGIEPSGFHGRRARNQLHNVLTEAATNVVRQKREEVTTRLKLQRAAFKDVTSLKTWPLQDMAMKDLDHWIAIHHGRDVETLGTLSDDNVADAETHGDSTGLSSSSLDEPKRTRRQDHDLTLSPHKSSMRHQFKMDFEKEREIAHGVSMEDGDKFASSLWCMEPRMFALEKSATGKRKYIVGHMGRFMDYYWRKCDPKHRHYYELIREKTPCRLYFDLEFSKGANPQITESISEMLIDEFLLELITEFKVKYDLDLERSCILDLESSTETKFSRHLIVHLPNQALFADATAAGRFVRVLIGRLAEEIATGQLKDTRPTLAAYLFVNTATSSNNNSSTSAQDEITSPSVDVEHQPLAPSDLAAPSIDIPASELASPSQDILSKSCFVDLGVYTRNRLFRLLGSSKFGKPASAALRIATNNTFPFPEGFKNQSFYVPEMEQHVMSSRQETNENDCEENYDMESEIKRFLSAVDWTDHATALAETLVVPMNGTKINYPVLEESEEAKALLTDDKTLTPPNASAVPSTVSRVGIRESSTQCMGVSPFPSVDDFVANVLGAQGGVQGAIRTWSIEEDTGDLSVLPRSITYQMSRNRWCQRIGRPHRSNNIMWIVDFATMSCIQSCHDPECRALRFRGVPVDLPASVREAIEDIAFERKLAVVDEQELLEQRTEPEKPSTFDDFDEDAFEMALLALDLNGVEPPLDSIETGALDQPRTTDDSTFTIKESDPLDDDALLNAMLSNPNLFP